MFTRIFTAISRSHIGTAWANSRIWAASMTGVLWSLNFFTIPIAKLLNGKGPGVIASSIGGTAFLTLLRSNYINSDPESLELASQKIAGEISFKQILTILNNNKQKSESLLQALKVNTDTLLIGDISQEDEAFIRKVYAATQNTTFNILSKYGVSALQGIFQTATHFCEPILFNVFGGVDFVYDFKSAPTRENIILGVTILVALTSGINTYLTTKNSLENPSMPVIAESLRLTLNAHRIKPAKKEIIHEGYVELPKLSV